MNRSSRVIVLLCLILFLCGVLGLESENSTVQGSSTKCSKKNEAWLPCGEYKNCEPMCGDLYQPCTVNYFRCPDGCQCLDGFARHPKSLECVPVIECSDYKPCGKNEVYKIGGYKCAESCDADYCSVVDSLPLDGCFCDGKSVRIKTECVPRTECKCPENTEWNDCGTFCIEHCDRDVIRCKAVCSPGCYCANEFAKINGTCQSRDLC